MLYRGMAKKRNSFELVSSHADDSEYDTVLADVAHLLESARSAAARSVNSIMTATYWAIGTRIVKFEQACKTRAAYGTRLVERLSTDLT